MAVKKYLSLERLQEYHELLEGIINSGDSSTLSSSKSYTDQEVSKIKSGSIVVKEAEHADSADEATHATSADSATSAASATKATQDGNGKVIADTYETKADASSKLAEAKQYTDTVASGKANSDHNHDDKYDAKNSASTAKTEAISSANSYTDEKIALLLNNSSEAVDSIYELRDAMEENQDAISALQSIASGKANAEHDHEIADVTGLQDALDGKAASSHGMHVTYSTTAPVMDGTAAVGTASTVARSDHKHPTDTSRASKIEFDTHVADAVSHITSTERTSWNGAVTKLSGIAEGANKTVVDTAMSTTSTNPVQNKVISGALSTLTETISLNTSSISQHNQAISNLQTAVEEIQEISSQDILNLFNS